MLAHEIPLPGQPRMPRPIDPSRSPLRELPRPGPRSGALLGAPVTFEGMVGNSPAMREAFSFLERLAHKSFHVRVHKRGPGKALSAHELERALGERMLGELAARGTPGRPSFADPDAILVVEIVDERAGIALFDRERRQRWPFLRLD